MDNNIHQFCTLNEAEMEETSLFPNILPNHKPIAVKSRHFNKEDQSFINKEIQKLLSEGIIEENVSPWQAQLVVVKESTKQPQKKKRVCVDYSQTINLYTELDAYSLPRIDKMINDLAKYFFLFMRPQKHLTTRYH